MEKFQTYKKAKRIMYPHVLITQFQELEYL